VGQGEFVLAKFEGWKGKFVVHPFDSALATYQALEFIFRFGIIT
jgi:hypothetical protein